MIHRVGRSVRPARAAVQSALIHLREQSRIEWTNLAAATKRGNDTIEQASPFNRVLGVGRSAIAAGALLTLLLTPQSQLFFRSESFPSGVLCQTAMSKISVFCVFQDGYLWVAKYFAVAVLSLVIIGVAPALTCVPHWWIAWSLYSTSPIPDGGDQVAAVATLLLVPLLLLDRRKSHWLPDHSYVRRSVAAKGIAYTALVVLWLQVMVIYFNAMIAKLAVPDWTNGTILWYWIQDPSFTPSQPILGLLQTAMATMPGTIALGYGVLILELALAMGIVLTRTWRHPLRALGLTFHLFIAITFGLWSFFFSMAGVLVLYLIRPTPPGRGCSLSERTIRE